jgi:hypothetical protein
MSNLVVICKNFFEFVSSGSILKKVLLFIILIAYEKKNVRTKKGNTKYFVNIIKYLFVEYLIENKSHIIMKKDS